MSLGFRDKDPSIKEYLGFQGIYKGSLGFREKEFREFRDSELRDPEIQGLRLPDLGF